MVHFQWELEQPANQMSVRDTVALANRNKENRGRQRVSLGLGMLTSAIFMNNSLTSVDKKVPT